MQVVDRKITTTFIFTVDVESLMDGNPSTDIWGILPGSRERFGITKIMDVLEAFNARATFFLNVYEIARHGEQVIRDAAELIHARGHDLELHTHPRPMYSYYRISDAPLADQIAIIEKGKTLLEKWTGKKIIAHRAGAFGANLDTLRAVESAGLLAECSLSYGSQVFTPLVEQMSTHNLIQRIGNIWEIPVTYYHQFRFFNWRSKRILDIEGSSLAEIKKVIRWALRSNIPTICILMHSFSFTRNGKSNLRVIMRLSALLAWLWAQNDIRISTIDQLCAELQQHSITQSTTQAAYTGLFLTWNRALANWNDGWKNRLFAAIGLISLVVVTLVSIYLGIMLVNH